ncbi:MAG: carboxypeptidase-like regulatory domain-containing protein [Myxococcota bacterium]
MRGTGSSRIAVAAAGALACALACAPAPVRPAEGRAAVAGSVRLVPHDGAPASSSSSSYGDRRLRDVELVDYSRPGFVIVWAERETPGAPAHDPGEASDAADLAIEDGVGGPRLAPELAAVGLGGTLRVANRTRRALAVSIPALGRVESLAPGAALSVAAERAGELDLFLLGARERATVWVAPGPWTRTDAAGRFALPDLAPGAWTVRAWHPRLPAAAQRVLLRAGEVADVALEIGVGRDALVDATGGGRDAAH